MFYYGKLPTSSNEMVVYAGAYKADDLRKIGADPVAGSSIKMEAAIKTEQLPDNCWYGYKWVKITDKPRVVLFGGSANKELLKSKGFIDIQDRLRYCVTVGWHPFTVKPGEIDELTNC